MLQVVLVVLALVWIVPFAWAVATSLKPDAETTVAPVKWLGTEQTLDAYRIAFEDGRILDDQRRTPDPNATLGSH